MSIDISRLKIGRKFENEKIKILFSPGDVSDSLSVYIKDENGKSHQILWKLSPDRCSQNFDKATDKIRLFVEQKIQEWVNEYEINEKNRKTALKEAEEKKENHLKELMNRF